MTGWLFAVAICCAGLPHEPVRWDALELRDAEGARWASVSAQDSRALVVVFLGVECPLAKLYAERLAQLAEEFGPQGVEFVAIDPNAHDGPEDLAALSAYIHWVFRCYPIRKAVRPHSWALRAP